MDKNVSSSLESINQDICYRYPTMEQHNFLSYIQFTNKLLGSESRAMMFINVFLLHLYLTSLPIFFYTSHILLSFPVLRVLKKSAPAF